MRRCGVFDGVERVGDGSVVGGGERKGLFGKAPAGFATEGGAVGAFHFFDKRGIVGGAGDDGYIFKVLGRGTNHGGAADVDVFDEVAEGDRRLGGGFLKGVEVDHNHVDGLDAVGGDGGLVLGVATNVKKAAMDAGVQCFDAAIEHFREAGEVADVFDLEAGLTQSAGGSAGRDQLHAKAGQDLGKFDQAGLVGHAEQGSADPLCWASV